MALVSAAISDDRALSFAELAVETSTAAHPRTKQQQQQQQRTMGISTATVAAVAGAAAAVGYAAGYVSNRAPAETNDDPPMYLARGGWKVKKEKDPNEVVEAGDAKKGAALFKAKCATCHSCIEGGPTMQGPNLYGIMGKEAGKSKGFKFTKNILGAGLTWDDETMHKWLENPKGVRRASRLL